MAPMVTVDGAKNPAELEGEFAGRGGGKQVSHL